jgi:hypothetical protein
MARGHGHGVVSVRPPGPVLPGPGSTGPAAADVCGGERKRDLRARLRAALAEAGSDPASARVGYGLMRIPKRTVTETPGASVPMSTTMLPVAPSAGSVVTVPCEVNAGITAE